MSEMVGAQGDGGRGDGGVDLALVARIEGELDAVERALEQIDQGVYEGFTGLGDAPRPAPVPEGAELPADPPSSAGDPPAYG